jgi:hypothetical protein
MTVLALRVFRLLHLPRTRASRGVQRGAIAIGRDDSRWYHESGQDEGVARLIITAWVENPNVHCGQSSSRFFSSRFQVIP